MMIEHPIPPLFDEESKVLILGSFPSVKSREQMFFYGHPQNRYWRVIARIFGETPPQSIEEKTKFAHEHHIAMWDVIASCEITGSSDASITNVVVNDLSEMIKNSKVRAIYCNGDKSYSLFMKYTRPLLLQDKEIDPAILNAIRLPSTSPANAAWSEDALVGAFARIRTSLARDDKESWYSLTDYCEDIYKKKLYRLSLDGGFTCPNRDGTLDTRGCIFCDAGGAGDFGGGRANEISEQIESQKRMLSAKLPKKKKIGYIAYFQSFTGTYAPIAYLREKYEQAMAQEDIDILSIATRPDCITKEVLALLKEINQKIPVWIELGLQTKHKKSIEYIRRGYDNKVYETAIRGLNEAGISQIITHVILGLPGETKKQMLESVSYVAKSGSTGIKLQLLHVLENTDMAVDYENGKFQTLSFEDYVSLTVECTRLLPPDMVVHRLTGDGNKNHLIAPLWSADKKRVINAVHAALKNAFIEK